MLLLLILALYVLPQRISLQESARHPADEASLNWMLICWWVESFLVSSHQTKRYLVSPTVKLSVQSELYA